MPSDAVAVFAISVSASLLMPATRTSPTTWPFMRIGTPPCSSCDAGGDKRNRARLMLSSIFSFSRCSRAAVRALSLASLRLPYGRHPYAGKQVDRRLDHPLRSPRAHSVALRSPWPLAGRSGLPAHERGYEWHPWAATRRVRTIMRGTDCRIQFSSFVGMNRIRLHISPTRRFTAVQDLSEVGHRFG